MRSLLFSSSFIIPPTSSYLSRSFTTPAALLFLSLLSLSPPTMSMSELRRQQYVIYLHDQILQIPKGYLKDATFVQIFEHLVMNLAAEQFPARTVNFTRACMEIIVVYCLTKKEASTAWLQSTEFERIEDLFQEFQAAASFIAENPLPQPPIWQATGKLTSETTA